MQPQHRWQAILAIVGISTITSIVIFATANGLARFFPAAILLLSGSAAAFMLTPRADIPLPPQPPTPLSPPPDHA